MKYTQLRAFQSVAMRGGFSAAGRALGLTQSAVSDQVLSLESSYDILLFDRSHRQVSLTEKGKMLLDITRPFFEAEAQALDFLTESREVTSGSLRVIADSAFHVTELLSTYRARFPKVKISLRSGNSAEVERALLSYSADIGVLGTKVYSSRFQGVTLGSTPIIAFAATVFGQIGKAEMTLSELVKYPLVLREEGSITRQKLEEAAQKQKLTLNPAIEAEGREAVREIVASGGGIGFVSEAEYGQDQRLRPIRIAGPAITMEETVVCIRQRNEVRTIRAFMAMAGEI